MPFAFMSLHLWAAICIYESFEKNEYIFNPFSANIAKWSNKLKQFVGSLTTNCLSVFDHFVGLALKGLTVSLVIWLTDYEESFINILYSGSMDWVKGIQPKNVKNHVFDSYFLRNFPIFWKLGCFCCWPLIKIILLSTKTCDE